VLVLDVLDNWVPASIVVHLVSVAGSINDVESQLHSILLNDVRYGLDFGSGPYWLIGGKSSFRVDQM
jgi:hypothetical protein